MNIHRGIIRTVKGETTSITIRIRTSTYDKLSRIGDDEGLDTPEDVVSFLIETFNNDPQGHA